MEHLLSAAARHATSSAIRDLLRLADAPNMLSLAGGVPAPELFPISELRAITEEVLGCERSARTALQYGPTEGIDELRALVLANEPPGSARDAIVTTGSQQALDLLARAFVDPEDIVVVESPAYLGALQALRGHNPNLVPVDSDREGMDTAQLADLLARGLRPTLCYLVPNFSNPSGATLSLERRFHLAALADRYDFLVVEDDPYGALRFEVEPLPSVAAFTSRVLTLGSSSKTLAPGLRVGWLVAPRPLIGALVRLKQTADLHTSSFSQAIVSRALTSSWYPAHLASLCDAYRARAAAVCGALASHEDVFAPPARPRGGIFVWVEGMGGIDAAEALRAALARGVAYVPGNAFATQDRYRHHARLSFANLSPVELGDAIHRLASTFRTVQAAMA